MKTVRVGAAQGFYGDSLDGAIANVKYGNIQYLSFDCLAELTMGILAKEKQRQADSGFTRDIGPAMKALLPLIKEKGIRILTNAGGINPEGAQKVVLEIARDLGMHDLKVAVITGDNLLPRLDELIAAGDPFEDLETGEPLTAEIHKKLLFANAYLGSLSLVEALRNGADIVITGRTTDTAQFLAPLIYEFGWDPHKDWNQLASGIFMGHLLECSAQSTGGNFGGNWQDIKGFEKIGYPIAEVCENGDFVVTKVKESGGCVTKETVKEQMLYEIHDPSAYITPDVVVDLTNVHLKEIGPDEVKITGVKGSARPSQLKVVMGYEKGWLGQVIVGYSWPDAFKKAQACEGIIRSLIKQKGLEYDGIRTDYLGYNSLHGPLAYEPDEKMNEIYLRMTVRSSEKKLAESFRRLFPPLALNGPPTMTYIGNIPSRQLLGMRSALIKRETVEQYIQISIEEAGSFVKSDA